jgi:hypothetical protein
MKPVVHILATVTAPDRLEAALLVFRSLRTGFPTAEVIVWGNGLADAALTAVRHAAGQTGCAFQNLPATFHSHWIESLIQRSPSPFWLCDTDIVFWEAVEHWFDVAASRQSADVPALTSGATGTPTFAGRLEPEFVEPWMDTLHVERLHTCLMYVDPVSVRCAMRAWMARIPDPFRNVAEFPFIRLTFIPRLGDRPLCYDALAGLYQASPGTPFTDAQHECFDHLACATYAREVAAVTPELSALPAVHRAVYADPSAARGLFQQQRDWYAQNRNGETLLTK